MTRSTPPEDHKKSNYRNDSKLSSIICAKKILVLPFLILKTQIMKFQLEKYSNIGVNNRLMNWGYTYKYIYRKEILKIRDIPSIPVLYVCAGWLPQLLQQKKCNFSSFVGSRLGTLIPLYPFLLKLVTYDQLNLT